MSELPPFSRIPLPLQEIPDPPKKLYLRGTLPDFTEYKYVCVVGSRKYSSYGKDVCEKLIEGLRGYPVAIVSGLALGMDAIAHEAALSAGLPTVAIPGSGLDPNVLHPATNRALADKIVLSGGALLSEYEPDFKATSWSFPRRNRLMAGIAQATLVIEAENKSGTRITAKLATEYNREVLAVPGSIYSKTSEGTNQLIREGATPITSPQDILEVLGFEVTETRPNDLMKNCTDEEKAVLKLLASPMPRGELMRQLPFSTTEANVLLGAMEIKGLIKEGLGEVRRS